MKREDAKAWFESHASTFDDADMQAAFSQAIEALEQPKFVALRDGDVAVLEVEHRLSEEQMHRIRKSWESVVGTRAVVLDGSIRLAGSVRREGASYEVPAVPL